MNLTLLIALMFISLKPCPEIVTAKAVIERCEQYRPAVERYTDHYPIDPDLVLAVMAKESACLPRATDGQSYGLMQVTPRHWTPTAEELMSPYTNIETGMWFMYNIFHHERNDGTWYRALAAYNCGWESLDADRCIPVGGPRYAESVLEFWLPLVVRHSLTTN